MTASPSAPRPAPASPPSKPHPARPRPRQQAGFTLLELSFMLAAMAGLVLVLAYLTADLFAQRQNIDGDRLLRLADAQVREFAARNGRLPCPDTTNDGVENCAAAPSVKGFLPYRTLGLATRTYVVGETPLRYGAYRNGKAVGANDADLATRKLRFSPRNSDGKLYPETDANFANSADLCLALDNASKLSVSTDYTYVTYPGGAPQNVAYAIAFPGTSDRDGDGSRYDLLNAGIGAGFQARNTSPGTDYDDKTLHRGFDELYVGLKCEVVLRSLDFVADAVAFEEEVFALADDNKDAAFVGTILAGVGTGVAAWGLGQSIAEVVASAEVLGTSIGLLSTASATCPIPVWVTCALIPVYATAVASASIGVGLAATGAALNGAAVGLQIVATIKYADIKSRTGLEKSSATPPASEADLAALQTQLSEKNTALQSAEAVLGAAVTAEAALRQSALTAKNSLDTLTGGFAADGNIFKPAFAQLAEQLFGKDTGDKEVVTNTFTNANGVEQTVTAEKPVITPGAYQALTAWREAKQAVARADTALQASVGAEESEEKQSAARQAKDDAQGVLTSAQSTLTGKRAALGVTTGKIDTYDDARIAQAVAKADLAAANADLSTKQQAYNAIAQACTDTPASCDTTARASALTALNTAQAAANAATTTYNARTAERATAYTALGALGVTAADTGDGGLCGVAACGLGTKTEAYLDAEQKLDSTVTRKSDGEDVTEAATSTRLAQEQTVLSLRSERDALVLKVGINTCARDGKDFDPVAKSCTAGAPGSGAAAATKDAVCAVGSKTYDQSSCDALSAGAGTLPAPLAPVKGSENILNSLKREGAVR